MRVAPDSVEPGKAVDISVKAKPNSYVGVLGVDQSVLLLKTGNDITQVLVLKPHKSFFINLFSFLNQQNDVLEEVKSYDSARRPDFASWLPEIGGRSFWWPSSATAGEVFSVSSPLSLKNKAERERKYETVFVAAIVLSIPGVTCLRIQKGGEYFSCISQEIIQRPSGYLKFSLLSVRDVVSSVLKKINMK